MNLSHTVKVVGSVVLSAVMAGSMMPVTVLRKIMMKILQKKQKLFILY
mgnify:FL=1